MNDKVGRPLKFESPQKLQEKIDEYYQWAKKHSKPLTITRLACFLDTSRKVLIEYEEKDEFSNTIKKAKNIIEADKNERLITARNVTGIIFDLKNNHDWRDTREFNGMNITQVVYQVNSEGLLSKRDKEVLNARNIGNPN